MPQKIAPRTRAYSTIEIKAASDEGGVRRFTGIATTPETDRMGDIVEPEGAKYVLPIPLLWQHDSRQPVGWVKAVKVSKKGIEVDCEMATITEEGGLKTRLDDAWQSLKAGLVRGLSIGFNPKEYSDIAGTWGLRYLVWEWLELSCVTIPANQSGSITAIKSVDRLQRAALGRDAGADDNTPGASGNQQPRRGKSNQGNTMKTLAELRAEQEEVSKRMKELGDLRKKDARSYTEEERNELGELQKQFDDIADDIQDMQIADRVSRNAKGVEGGNRQEGSGSRGPTIIGSRKTDVAEKFKGQMFVRQVIARAVGMMQGVAAAEVARARWGKDCPQLVEIIRAGVPGAGSESGEWGAELADVNTRYTGDFLTYLYAQTVFDKLGLREVPRNVRVKGQDGAATGFWVGQSRPIPVTTVDFSSIDLAALKVAAIAVASNELLADSSPAAEQLIRDALVEASSQRVDTTFLSASAASAGISPAGILNGVTALTTTGNDAASVLTNINKLYSQFLTDKNASGLVHVMNPATSKAIGLLQNALGLPAYPGLGADGGTLAGDRVVTGDNVAVNDWLLLKPSDIWRIGDTGVEISVSREAMIEQDSAPAGRTDTPVAATATFTSMFQEDSAAIKVVRRVNYQKRRANAVAYITDADYNGITS